MPSVVYVIMSGTVNTAEDDELLGYVYTKLEAETYVEAQNAVAASDQSFWYETVARIQLG